MLHGNQCMFQLLSTYMPWLCCLKEDAGLYTWKVKKKSKVTKNVARLKSTRSFVVVELFDIVYIKTTPRIVELFTVVKPQNWQQMQSYVLACFIIVTSCITLE